MKQINKKLAALWLPPVSALDNKVTRGKALLFAGSAQFPGAGILAAQGALRMGCGYVTLAQKNVPVSFENPDFLLLDIAKQSWTGNDYGAVLIGPGFGVNDDTYGLLQELRRQNVVKVVVDADALTVCAQKKFFPLPSTWVVTPHGGELARLLNISSEEINRDRCKALQAARDLLQCVVVLKGAGTLIAGDQGTSRIATGNAALAKAGTGDVLAGMITALCAQGLESEQAAGLGAYLHGATANVWAAQKNDLLSMRAVDILEILPRVVASLRRLKE